MWLLTHRMQPIWPNIPPAPPAHSARYLGLGDAQFAYRQLAYPLQIMGNTAGQSTPLYLYDYNRLGSWLELLHRLDARSDYVPYLAAYYFGATQDPMRQLPPVIDYLARAGHEPYAGKWRWLSQASFMAFHRRGDHTTGIRLAHQLAGLPRKDMPHWAYQMPAILSGASGDKETAVKLMSSILVATLNDPYRKADPVEVNFMVDFICNRMQTPAEARGNPLCQIPDLQVP